MYRAKIYPTILNSEMSMIIQPELRSQIGSLPATTRASDESLDYKLPHYVVIRAYKPTAYVPKQYTGNSSSSKGSVTAFSPQANSGR